MAEKELFGTALKTFDREHLEELMIHGKIERAQRYVSKYFAKTLGNTIFYYRPLAKIRQNKYTKITYDDCRNLYIPKLKFKSFDIQAWFLRENAKSYMMGADISKPRVYHENGENFVNFAEQLKHSESTMKYAEFAPETREAVELLLKHVKEVLCSSKEDQYNHLLKCLSKICTGQKLRVFIYFQSEEGTGKSLLTQFLIKHVIGESLCFRTSDAEHLTEKFNACIFGKALNVCEELPTFSTSEWKKANARLKTYTTEDTLAFQDKFEKKFEGENITNFIINTNVSALQWQGRMRRCFSTDISPRYIGNKQYFQKLAKAIMNDDVGECFYALMRETCESLGDWAEDFDMPTSEMKTVQAIRAMHPIFKFIRDNFLLKGISLTLPYSDLEAMVNTYIDEIHGTALQYKELSRKLRGSLFTLTERGSRKCWVDTPHAELVKIYKQNAWLDEDEDEPEYNEKNDTDYLLALKKRFTKPDRKAEDKQYDEEYNYHAPKESETATAISVVFDE